MAARRLPMRKVREILRLSLDNGLGDRPTARACGVPHSTVQDYKERASRAGLSWEEVASMDRGTLERRLFPKASRSTVSRPVPSWSKVHKELKHSGVTLQLLWEEYREAHPEGYSYSRFCELYQAWRGQVDLSMRQTHKAGEKVFVDYCGQTVPVGRPGEERPAEIFVAVLGASNYTYAEATWSQQLQDWAGSHCRAFEYFDGVPEVVVPDNLKSGVTKACRYEPVLTRTYEEMAAHYGVAVIPARVRKPKDKAKVETGVQVVERWILASLRHRQFFSLGELNVAVAELLERLNHRPFKKLPGTRRSLFETLDQPALGALPARPYEYADWSKVRVGPDYHVEVDGHYYSVPYQLVRAEVEARSTASTVEILHADKRVVCHRRSCERGQASTLPEHMPPAHRGYAEQTPQKLLAWGEKVGAATSQVVETMLSRAHPLQGFHSCLGLRRLAKDYGENRLECACRRAIAINGMTYRSLRSILQRNLDQHEVKNPVSDHLPRAHENVRGASYYENSPDPVEEAA